MNAETSVYDYSARVRRARALMNSHDMDAIVVRWKRWLSLLSMNNIL